MTSTPRLDSLTAGGTNDVFDGIRLADGHVLTLKTRPGADTAEEVFLYAGLTAPDTEAWENEDQWEEWLTGGNLGEGSLYVDVPVEAVRDLIVQHGGEHDDQEPAPESTGKTDEGETAEVAATRALAEWITTSQTSPDPMTQLADLHGAFEIGYSADEVRSVFGRIAEEGGPYLVCVWDYADEYGFGGNSQFYAEGEDGGLFEVQPDLHLWLSGQQETPGPLDTWVCAPVAEPTEFPVSDDFHNYARVDRTDD
ncbi:hypothetical protein [Wenjunlia tyrosinilytica]|uniref:Uncharacterized protein n=1 Tax=Wenjunlia tyrosinilytica TaxID=1544741 RepID=A0A918E241_9ACTN|nr:hypothetical protein [Wenjunlia tyrosinilytica]GGO98346.1 hypothetical protein GCM10012280_62260 [Wenjunlia tyrosinilytica]